MLGTPAQGRRTSSVPPSQERARAPALPPGIELHGLAAHVRRAMRTTSASAEVPAGAAPEFRTANGRYTCFPDPVSPCWPDSFCQSVIMVFPSSCSGQVAWGLAQVHLLGRWPGTSGFVHGLSPALQTQAPVFASRNAARLTEDVAMAVRVGRPTSTGPRGISGFR